MIHTIMYIECIENEDTNMFTNFNLAVLLHIIEDKSLTPIDLQKLLIV